MTVLCRRDLVCYYCESAITHVSTYYSCTLLLSEERTRPCGATGSTIYWTVLRCTDLREIQLTYLCLAIADYAGGSG